MTVVQQQAFLTSVCLTNKAILNGRYDTSRALSCSVRRRHAVVASAPSSSHEKASVEKDEQAECDEQKGYDSSSRSKFSTNPLNPLVGAVRRKIEGVQTKFQNAARDVKDLESSSEDDVFGADLEGTSLGSRSTIQDLSIPKYPSFIDTNPSDVISLLTKYVAADKSRQDLSTLETSFSRLLLSLRLAAAKLADKAEGVFRTEVPDDGTFDKAIPSFLSLLHLAKFHCSRPVALSPESVDSLPLKISVSNCLDESLLKERGTGHPLLQRSIDLPEHFPHLLVATRGTGVNRKSGLLLGAKFRAIEEEYLSWAQAPFYLIRQILEQITGGKSDEFTNTEPSDRGGSSGKVRRVFPSVKLNGWKGLTELLLPVFTQEPTHKLYVLAYREFVPDIPAQRLQRRQRTLEAAQTTIAKAIDPVRYRTVVEEQLKDCENEPGLGSSKDRVQLPGEYRPFRTEMYGNVPWGNIAHYFPSCAVKVTLQSREILKLDLLTLAGVVSCLVTAVRNIDKSYIVLSVTGTIAAYVVRIVFRLRAALKSNRGFLAEEKANHFVAANEAVVARLAGLVVEEQFAIAASCLVSKLMSREVSPSEIQNSAFGKVLSTEDENAEWMSRLQQWRICEDSQGTLVDERLVDLSLS